MSLIVLTGAVRSGKSAAAERLAGAHGGAVVVAVAGWEGDEEMRRRVLEHRGARPEGWRTQVVGADAVWMASVLDSDVLLLDCLATLVSNIVTEEVGDADLASAEAEAACQSRAEAIVDALLARGGDTIVVTNEAGWGVVPVFASGRTFRDVLGRCNRRLVSGADAAWLVIDGRMLDLKALPSDPTWPGVS